MDAQKPTDPVFDQAAPPNSADSTSPDGFSPELPNIPSADAKVPQSDAPQPSVQQAQTQPAQQPAELATFAAAAPAPQANTAPPAARDTFAPDDGQYGGPPPDDSMADGNVPPMPPEVTWQAAEFAAHHKSPAWYLAFVGVSLAVLVVTYLLTRDIMTVVIILICAGLFGYMAARQPRMLSYGLSDAGVYVGNRFYPYKDFNAFAVADEGPITGINFTPLKRFAPTLSIYCNPDQESGVVELLSQHLPLSYHQRSAIDGLMHRIRF